jgi:hypothetical protein
MPLTINEILSLRAQFQDAVFSNQKTLWSNLKLTLTLVALLFSIQSGIILWITNHSTDYATISLIISPLGIWTLCIIGFINAKRSYRNLLRNLSCIIKIEGELDLSRQNKSSFENDNSLLFNRWVNVGKNYKTSDDFVNSHLGITDIRGNLTTLQIITIIYISISILAAFILIILELCFI